MLQDYKHYLDPATLSRLSNMELRARLVVEGFITGLHKSPYHGFSVEFAQHRQYMPGDEIRRLDWKVYGKTDRFYVKEYEEETNLKSYILLDTSGSMGYGSGAVTKLQYGAFLASALTYLMLKQRDAVGLALMNHKIERYIPPRSVMGYLHVILRTLVHAEPCEETAISGVFHELAERIRRRGLIIVISDLFDEPDRVLSGLKHFRHRNHEVLLFHVLDPLELSFEFGKEATFRDLETGDEMVTQSWHLQADYQEQMQRFIADFRRICRQERIDYVQLDTGRTLDTALVEYLIKRKRLT